MAWAVSMVGSGKAAYEQAGKWARYRHQFDRPICEFELIQDKLAEMVFPFPEVSAEEVARCDQLLTELDEYFRNEHPSGSELLNVRLVGCDSPSMPSDFATTVWAAVQYSQ